MKYGWHELVWVLVALVLSMGTSPAMADGQSRLAQRIQVQIAEEEAGNMVFSTAAHMYRDYQSNELAADERYKGKWVEVEGRVLGVAKSPSGKPYVTLMADQHGIGRIHAQLFPYQIGEILPGEKGFTTITDMDAAIGLHKGQKIKIDGKGAGAIMGIPRLSNCIIVTW